MSQFLYQELDTLSKLNALDKSIPLSISKNLKSTFEIRDYQKEAFARFIYYINQYPERKLPIHLLYNMATGSGKTFVMAGLILYLYEKGYRNFLFFVNSTNIIEKTKENFLNKSSMKYLFNDKIVFDDKLVNIKEVDNFTNTSHDDIHIKFTTIHGLHSDLNTPKENGLSYEDFESDKIVILSDEAHHINATTKKSKLSKMELEDKSSRENTVMKVLDSHLENILLEFTATLDYTNEGIVEKYIDKVIYKYSLKEFRLDKYSKEVDILKSDLEQDERVLQSLVLSQYRLKVAEMHKIYCKPVILFKAQKTIDESQQNKDGFIKFIKNLDTSQVDTLKSRDNVGIVQKAFKFFEEQSVSIDDLVRELKEDFAEENCLSANDNIEADKNQILLNTLEDKSNRIRAIFAVQKLNEGWDVLNLFDIVRMYDNRDSSHKGGKITPGKGTMAEAQLIGRGARYFPFSTDEALGEDKYKRKFDKMEHELKILETFYYHTVFNNEYISEIRQALKDTGIIEEKDQKEFKLELKDPFKESVFYKDGVIYTNKRVEKDVKGTNSLLLAGISSKRRDCVVSSGKTATVKVFGDALVEITESGELKTFNIGDIETNIIRKAIMKNDFYKFNNLKKYLGGLNSISELIENEKYLGDIKIDVKGSKQALDNMGNEDKLKMISYILKKLEAEIKDKKTEFEGTKEFKARSIKKELVEKTINIPVSEDGFAVDSDWFAFKRIVGTSEERSFVELFEKKISQLEEKYSDIYLIRSERHFAIYSFNDGRRFEPDFVLFMKDKNTKDSVTYQVFIEPKGDHLLLVDKWKEDFLKEIGDKAEILEINFGNYKLIGLPFYNKQLEHSFEEVFDREVLV